MQKVSRKKKDSKKHVGDVWPISQSLSDVLLRDPLGVIDPAYDNIDFIDTSLFIIKDRGYYRPILPIEIALYNYSVYEKGKDLHKYSGVHMDYALRDGILHQLITVLKEKVTHSHDETSLCIKNCHFQQVINKYVPFAISWLKDLDLRFYDVSGGRGYRSTKGSRPTTIQDDRLIICKYCFKPFDSIMPYDNLCRESSSQENCYDKYSRYFFEHLIEHVKEAKNRLLEVFREVRTQSKKLGGLDDLWIDDPSIGWMRDTYSKDIKESITKVRNIINTEITPKLVERFENKENLFTDVNYEIFGKIDKYKIYNPHEKSKWYGRYVSILRSKDPLEEKQKKLDDLTKLFRKYLKLQIINRKIPISVL